MIEKSLPTNQPKVVSTICETYTILKSINELTKYLRLLTKLFFSAEKMAS